LCLFERVDWLLTRSTGQGSSGIQPYEEGGAPICHQEKAEKATIRGREIKSELEIDSVWIYLGHQIEGLTPTVFYPGRDNSR
jgi:hypothetical protein